MSCSETTTVVLEVIPGAWVEDKGLTLTIHMREVPTASVPLVQRQVIRLLRPALEARTLVLRPDFDTC
jgi:trehalose-6-phosphatase